MPTPSNFGADYSRYFTDDGSDVPFPRPVNDAQRQANARARAQRGGQPIGSGYLNPQSGQLQDPDRGFMRVVAENPWLGALIALSPALPVGLAGGGGAGAAAGTAGVIPGTGIPTVAGAGGAAAGVTAPAVTAGTIAGAGAGATSVIDKIRKSLTTPEGVASLAALVPSLIATAKSGGSGTGAGADELRRIQAITEARMRRADPLHEVATQLAFQRAPIAAKAGISLPRVTLPQ